MHRLAVLICALVAFASSARATVEQDYLQIYLKLNDSERLERQEDYLGALSGFEDCYKTLFQIRQAHRDWEPVLIQSRLQDCYAKICALEGKVNRSGKDSSNRQEPAKIFDFADPWLTPAKPEIYPWKTDIPTTVFWLDEHSTATSWDRDWIHHNGGPDDEFDMSGYASGKHASMLNPFYVSLPFNDLTHPKLKEKWVPGNWLRLPVNGQAVSWCKDRWIEIKNREGRVCFAQWEDVGPIDTDDAGYVFGGNRPKASRGLSVSPAVAKYLGIGGTSLLSWRFVDDSDVAPGLWLRYDEQAILFRALHEEDGKSTGG